jgi:predicted phosphohydrolase
MTQQRYIDVQGLPESEKQERTRTRFVVLSDTHNRHNELDIPDGDVLLHCGDFTTQGLLHHVVSFNNFLGRLPHKHKLVCPGNHERWPDIIRPLLTNCNFLCDDEYEVNGITIYGSRWKPRFSTLSAHYRDAKQSFEDVPTKTQILITHQPAMGIGNLGGVRSNQAITDRVLEIKPLVHCFGHDHSHAGDCKTEGVTFINAAIIEGKRLGTLRHPYVFDIYL